jgi:hypothetical protein
VMIMVGDDDELVVVCVSIVVCRRRQMNECQEIKTMTLFERRNR